MERIDVIIATRNRYKKLIRTIESIPKRARNIPVYINVTCDGDLETYNAIRHDKRIKELIFVGKQMGAVYCRNELSTSTKDAVIYATDDVIFSKNAIDKVVEMFFRNFSDDDGVVGFCQTGNHKFSKSGVALMGRAFVDRYPDRKIFYPKYFHFACQEILSLAEKKKKFVFCESAIVEHLNPNVNKKWMDKTHADARIHKTQDHVLMQARDKAGEIWGDDGKS